MAKKHNTKCDGEGAVARIIPITANSHLMKAASSRNDSSEEGDEAKLKQYAAFIDHTLHPELKKRVEAREEIENEIKDYRDLSVKLQSLIPSSSMKALVDLGHQTVYCEAVANDNSKLFVHVGMGFHAEMTIPEAIAFCEKRIQFLNSVLEQRAESAAQVARHLQASLLLLEQLADELAGRRA
ncbi:Prefoldin subunit [Fragilaria crotonensis]|nr:Prefoldin subunit [Fragilaria crotonensis]